MQQRAALVRRQIVVRRHGHTLHQMRMVHSESAPVAWHEHVIRAAKIAAGVTLGGAALAGVSIYAGYKLHQHMAHNGLSKHQLADIETHIANSERGSVTSSLAAQRQSLTARHEQLQAQWPTRSRSPAAVQQAPAPIVQSAISQRAALMMSHSHQLASEFVAAARVARHGAGLPEERRHNGPGGLEEPRRIVPPETAVVVHSTAHTHEINEAQFAVTPRRPQGKTPSAASLQPNRVVRPRNPSRKAHP